MKPGGTGKPGIGHFGQTGAFAAQEILHIAAPVGSAIGKEIDKFVRHSAYPRMMRKFEGATRILESGIRVKIDDQSTRTKNQPRKYADTKKR